MPKSTWHQPPPGYPTFDSDLAELRKHFPKIDDDLSDLQKHLEEHAGEREGKVHRPLPKLGNKVWKIRWSNTSKAAGKSGGIRLLYYLRVGARVYPLRIYDKGDREDVPSAELGRNLQRFSDAVTVADKKAEEEKKAEEKAAARAPKKPKGKK